MILITGGLGGLGKEIAARFSEVLITTSRKEQVSQQVLYWDMNCSDSTEQLIKNLPEINTFIHCAHIFTPSQPSIAIESSELLRSLNANIGELFILTKYLARKMNRKKQGNLIFIGSQIALEPAPGKLIYITEKMALIGMISAFRSEFPQLNWQVLNPGLIDTPQVKKNISLDIQQKVGTLLSVQEVADKIIEMISNPSRDWVHSLKGNQNWTP